MSADQPLIVWRNLYDGLHLLCHVKSAKYRFNGYWIAALLQFGLLIRSQMHGRCNSRLYLAVALGPTKASFQVQCNETQIN